MSVKSFTIDDTVNNLINAADADDDKTAQRMAIILLGGVALNLQTIAKAIEKLSTFELEKVGEIMRVGPVFSAEEVETIEALRRGDIVVVPNEDNGTLAPDYASHKADEYERAVMQFYHDNAITIMNSKKTAWADLSEVERIEWRKRFDTRVGTGG